MRKPRSASIVGAGCLLFVAVWLLALETEDILLIKGAKLYTLGPEGVLQDAGLLIQGGKIKRIFRKDDKPALPSEGKGMVIDYSGKSIIPGMVDAHTYLSGYYRLLENTEPITSDLAAYAVFDALNTEVQEALRSGITTVNFSPRNENLVAGISSVMKLPQSQADILILKKEAFLKISFNASVVRPDRAPTSLMGAQEMLSETMRAVRGNRQGAREGIFGQKAILRLLDGNLPPMIAASTFAEINTALKWLETWKLKGVIVGGEEAHLLSRALKEREIPVLLSPFLPASPEKMAANAALLAKQGIAIAFVSHMPEGEPLWLRLSALMLYHQNISQEEALKTITLNPARILGVADSVGSIEVGKDADLVVFLGEPLDLRSKIEAVYINGRNVFEKGN